MDYFEIQTGRLVLRPLGKRYLKSTIQYAMDYENTEGIKIGEQRVNKLNALLIQNNRFEDLKRSTNDKQFQQQLMAEYKI